MEWFILVTAGMPMKAKSLRPTNARRTLKTLDRVLSKAGVGSRTEARGWIGTGRVRVNGRLVQTPDHWVDLDRDQVTLDGKPVLSETRRYLLLYKPKGYITTYKDPEGRPRVARGSSLATVPYGMTLLSGSSMMVSFLILASTTEPFTGVLLSKVSV